MTRKCLLVLMLLAFGIAPSAKAASSARDLDTAGAPFRPAKADPAISKALDRIAGSEIEHTIRTLVAFHTRSTLSSIEADLPAGQGINAAADWIEAEFKRYSAECGGCLEIKRDVFTQAPQNRIPKPTTITNVYAILRGSDPVQAKRMYLVTGHYDSRVTDVLDARAEAPGANDDASGVAVSLACAHALSKLKPAATLVFVAVAAEEQGLLGSHHLAALAKSQGWQLEGVLNNDIVGGNTTPGDPLQDKSAVRVFSEGIPATATAEQAKQADSLGYSSDSSSRELARAVVDVGATYGGKFQPVLEFRRDRFLRGGDHISFNQEGFAAVRFTEWREDFNHQHQNLRTENGMERSVSVTDKTVTLPVSKDNVIFGVRSADAAGHRSLTVVPTPLLPKR